MGAALKDKGFELEYFEASNRLLKRSSKRRDRYRLPGSIRPVRNRCWSESQPRDTPIPAPYTELLVTSKTMPEPSGHCKRSAPRASLADTRCLWLLRVALRSETEEQPDAVVSPNGHHWDPRSSTPPFVGSPTAPSSMRTALHRPLRSISLVSVWSSSG